ncbi:hypothetical protein E4T44_04153 [Aureobasidium sp. EXF-8845]|nr:hypothetical protein E4T44_04153 [Aureobasidium sp. EXF-8845]KAI4852856.1 hypothetical protein E4T45_04551 [Aureobasidium sp. EXF-8846]
MQTISMSSYFDFSSWTKARKNREALEKTNPQNPVLNDDDEEFLQRITSQEAPAPPLPTIEPTVIDDEGNERKADVSQKEAADMILPASPGEASEKRTWASYIPNVAVPSVPAIPAIPAIPAMPSLASLRGRKADAKVDEKETATKTDSATEEKEPSVEKPVEQSTQDGKNDLADQVAETGQAAKENILETKDELTKDATSATETGVNTEAEGGSTDDTKSKLESDVMDTTDDSSEQTTDSKGKQPAESTPRTWASYIPAIPAVPTFGRSKAQETAEAAAANQSPEAKEQDEREVSVLLDRLNLSAINNRVFSFSDQSQKLYGEFTLILKDIVNGAPTAWDDLENLLKNNDKQLQQTFKSMPPFVQTLVKSLPAKFATSMGPEIMAMAGDKPGNDLKKQMEAAGKASSSISAQNINLDVKKKQKRRVPNIKDLAAKKGAVTSMLTNIVNFLKLRFPAFVTGTNVVMSLAVFILLFVFWYCRKRGKEVRMLRESEESAKHSADVSELESSSSEDETEKYDADNTEVDVEEKMQDTEMEEAQSDTEDVKIANAKAYAAAMNRSVGGPNNAAALRAKKILES